MSATTIEQASEDRVTARPGIITSALLRVFAVAFGALSSFYLLLSVVPVYATSVGVGRNAAGLATGALMLSTVAAELVTPRLVHRLGYRSVLATALVLLGVPLLILPAVGGVTAIVAVCVVRGLGFGIVVVTIAALVATLVPSERRGAGLGLYGVIVGVPSIVALPLGLWLSGQIGYAPVFLAGAVLALVGLVMAPGLPRRVPAPQRSAGMRSALRTGALLRPAVVFSATTMAAGVVVTFLPLALSRGSADLVTVALLIQAAASALTRWLAGLHGDRHGQGRLLIPGLIVSATGVLGLVLIGDPAAVLLGLLVFGAGFGVTQNASLAMMFDRVPASGYGMVSAVWNLAYDGGLGLGAAGFGVLAAWTGYSTAFVVTAALMFTTLAPAWRDRRLHH